MITDWMLKCLHLSGNDLLVFAIIYGFSQDGETKMKGGYKFITELLNISKKTAFNTVKKLVENELVIKHELSINGVVFNEYSVNMETLVKITTPMQNQDNTPSKNYMGGMVKFTDPPSKNYQQEYIYRNNKENIYMGEEKIVAPNVATPKNVSLADSRKKREEDFYESLKVYLEEYPKEMLRGFFDYWSEPNKSGSKMKFEMEKTWDIKRRLATWSRNQSKFDHGTNRNPQKQTADERDADIARQFATGTSLIDKISNSEIVV